MADYKELLRRAIDALPENNGAARRAVYEKARAALVGQLKAISPPLPAKDITQHRLQLEDCIRQVEHEASEAVISLKADDVSPRASIRPRPKPEPAPKPKAPVQAEAPPAVVVRTPEPLAPPAPPLAEAEPVVESLPEPRQAEAAPEHSEVPELVPVSDMPPSAPTLDEPPRAEEAPPPKPVSESKLRSLFSVPFGRGPKAEPKPEPEAPPEPMGSIEDIIAEAERTSQAVPPGVEPDQTPEIEPQAKPSVEIGPALRAANVSRIDARPAQPRGGEGRRVGFEPRREGAQAVAFQPVESSPRGNVVALQQVSEPTPVSTAMSSVREVEVESLDIASDPQRQIENAIATLDREARGETESKPVTPPAQFPPTRIVTSSSAPAPAENKGEPALDEADESLGRTSGEEKSGNAITIFLVVFAVLLAAAGGGGFWAWREGFIDMDAMFGPAETQLQANISPAPSGAPGQTEIIETADATGPGNTTPLAEAIEPTPELITEERLAPSPEGTSNGVTPVPIAPDVAAVEPSDSPPGTTTETVVLGEADTAPILSPEGEEKIEERLTASDPEASAETADLNLTDPSAIAGSQSLLLEAADSGQGGAIPFSGTVDWSTGTDEVGLPTIIGRAVIPARNMEVDILIRKNSDVSLPASHLMEIRFDVSETFIGGAIATLPGVLLKNEELVQGEALAGASARVVGNSFLFALSERPDDLAENNRLLTSSRWMDLAVVYATGKRAIITLEKDDVAEAMFTDVFNQWNAPAEAASTD